MSTASWPFCSFVVVSVIFHIVNTIFSVVNTTKIDYLTENLVRM